MRPRLEVLKRCIAMMISIMPLNSIRVALYRLIFRYEIAAGARIGFGTVMLVDRARIGAAHIALFNVFVGPFSLEVGDGASIGSRNRIVCGGWVAQEQFKDSLYARICRLGCSTLITEDHYIDPTGGFELQDRSWIAGRGSQFWTHGVTRGPVDRFIRIGCDNYIGSAVRFGPASGTANKTTVAMGSVVTKRFAQERVVIAGVPARIIKEGYYFRDEPARSAEPVVEK